LEQLSYQRVAGEWEHYENQIWQVTTFFMTILGSLIFYSYLSNESCVARISTLLVAIVAGFNLRLALVKHRFFSKTRSVALENMELRAYEAGTIPFIVQRATFPRAENEEKRRKLENAYGKYIRPRTWSERQSAVTWLIRTITGALWIVVVLALFSLIAFISQHWFGQPSSLSWFGNFCAQT
jgi:hypothetical protein